MIMTKNYTSEGGAKTFIGGELEFGADATVKNAPFRVDNVEADTGAATKNAAVLNALLAAMKKSGIMVGDSMNVSIPSGITYSGMATDETVSNSNKVTATLSDGVITVACGGKVEDELEEADHGTTWGKHYWLGFGVRTGLATDAGVVFEQKDNDPITLSAEDEAEAHSVGLAEAGDIILYIKAEKVRDEGGFEFSLAKEGYETEYFKVVIDETGE